MPVALLVDRSTGEVKLSSEQFFRAVDWNAFAKSCESGNDFMEAIDEASAEIEYLGSENYDAGR